MSLEHHQLKDGVFHPIVAIGFVNFSLMVFLVIMSATIFARPSGVEMEFPGLGQDISPGSVVIQVTGENVIYIDGHVVTLNELRRFLAEGNFRRDALAIKADPKASMGRVADILDLCRGISGASVNVSTIL